MCGAMGSFILQNGIGYILHWTHDSYAIPFAIAGSAYLAALLVIHVLLPRLEPMVLDERLQN
jgi:ACS family hexuronate transporter-like MFS transporter